MLGGEKGLRGAVPGLGRLLGRSGDRAAGLYEVRLQETPDVARARRWGPTDAYRCAPRLSLGQVSEVDLFDVGQIRAVQPPVSAPVRGACHPVAIERYGAEFGITYLLARVQGSGAGQDDTLRRIHLLGERVLPKLRG